MTACPTKTFLSQPCMYIRFSLTSVDSFLAISCGTGMRKSIHVQGIVSVTRLGLGVALRDTTVGAGIQSLKATCVVDSRFTVCCETRFLQ